LSSKNSGISQYKQSLIEFVRLPERDVPCSTLRGSDETLKDVPRPDAASVIDARKAVSRAAPQQSEGPRAARLTA